MGLLDVTRFTVRKNVPKLKEGCGMISGRHLVIM